MRVRVLNLSTYDVYTATRNGATMYLPTEEQQTLFLQSPEIDKWDTLADKDRETGVVQL